MQVTLIKVFFFFKLFSWCPNSLGHRIAIGMTRNWVSSLKCKIWRKDYNKLKTQLIRIGIAQEQLRVVDSSSPCRMSKSIRFLKHLLLWAIAHFGLEQLTQTFQFINQHWFHIDFITSNYNFESMLTKHKVVIYIVNLFLYFIDASPTLKGWIIVWVDIE